MLDFSVSVYMFTINCNIPHRMRDGCCYEGIVASSNILYPRRRRNELLYKPTRPVATAPRPASSMKHARRQSGFWTLYIPSALCMGGQKRECLRVVLLPGPGQAWQFPTRRVDATRDLHVLRDVLSSRKMALQPAS